MSIKLPLVTIVIANYNHEDKVLDAINSVLDQDYPNLALVIVDDASTDNSWEVIQKHLGGTAEKDKPVQLEAKGKPVVLLGLSKNVGRSKARNIGIKLLFNQTHIFGNLDSDDLYLPGKISKSVLKIMENPEAIGVVYSDFIREGPNGTITEYKRPFDAVELYRECIINNDSLVTKAALEQRGLYDESMEVAEDWDLWLRITSRYLAIHIAEPLVKVRITNKGATANVDMSIWQKNWNLIHGRLVNGYYAQ